MVQSDIRSVLIVCARERMGARKVNIRVEGEESVKSANAPSATVAWRSRVLRIGARRPRIRCNDEFGSSCECFCGHRTDNARPTCGSHARLHHGTRLHVGYDSATVCTGPRRRRQNPSLCGGRGCSKFVEIDTAALSRGESADDRRPRETW
jgi:hypothetical protein